jgi:ubiquinol-cytochrome c reductase cytochrome c1 subunit
MRISSIIVLALLSCFVLSGAVRAEEHSHGHVKLPHRQWSFDGIFGTYDRAELQRGLQVYRQVCSSCHSMKSIAFRNLADLGYTEGQIKAIAAEYMIADGPNDEGDMFERAGRPSDYFPSPYPNKQAAKFANNGAAPPDFSLLAQAREGGPNYIAAILTGYDKDRPEDVQLQPGQYWNKYMAGHIIAMPPPLADGQVAYEDDTPQTLDQYAHDVAAFLAWASDPHMEARKRTGIKAFLYLFVFTLVMYAVKKKVWSKV